MSYIPIKIETWGPAFRKSPHSVLEAKMPRFNPALLSPEELVSHNHRISSRDAAATARHKDLADVAQIKYENAIELAHYIEERDAAAKAARIIKLGKRINDLGRVIVETEAEFATFTGDKVTQLETLGYSLEVYLEETMAMLRNTERELSQLLGNPPSAEELEEKELQKTFVSLSFKAGMAAYVREDILESAPYHEGLKAYWNQHIEACQEAIDSNIPLGHE